MRYYFQMTSEKIRTVATQPFKDQRPGTSGLRKKTKIFLQPHYIENFVQSIFDTLRQSENVDFSNETLAVGGDGRFYNRAAIQIILRIAAANGLRRILVGRGGLLSTPAMSALIRRRRVLGGILLTASHNPGGPDADFGIKYNIHNGGPAPEPFTEAIYAESQKITRFLAMDAPSIDIDQEGTTLLGDSRITVIDPLVDYMETVKKLFDFEAIRGLFQSGFRLLFDAMHGVTGIYARHIFENQLGAPAGTVVRGTPLEGFGGLHPDPNQVHAAELVRSMSKAEAPEMGAACDGDGDRNMILGRSFFVNPGDSLAVIAEHAHECIPGYAAGLAGVARSMPTSTALDRVAAKLGIACHETPTGWKYFGNLMDAGMCTICGEESFGTGSDHVREKDGLWAVLAWLSILAVKKCPVVQIVQNHWQQFGRSYFQRHDYEKLDSSAAKAMIDEVRGEIGSLAGTRVASASIAQADDFEYTDPVDGIVSAGQGLRIRCDDGSRIVGRLSGTGTEGATLRLYFERYRQGSEEPVGEMLQPLVEYARSLFRLQARFGREKPSVIT
jgi:phosphoglucomutase